MSTLESGDTLCAFVVREMGECGRGIGVFNGGGGGAEMDGDARVFEVLVVVAVVVVALVVSGAS